MFSLSLDGVDGPLARRAGLESAFGARYDMEIDALLALVLSLLDLAQRRARPLGARARHHALRLPRRRSPLPALRAPLFPSMRRKSVCVVQIAALCAIVSPLVAPPLSVWIGLAATLALAFSFGRDTRWLLRRPVGRSVDQPADSARA